MHLASGHSSCILSNQKEAKECQPSLWSLLLSLCFFGMGWIPRGEGWKTAFGVVAGPVITAALFVFYNIIRAPILLDQDMSDRLKAREITVSKNPR